jgi:hypothetical protein
VPPEELHANIQTPPHDVASTQMTHELTKELKDAGFQQPQSKYDSGKSGMGYDLSGDIVYYDNCCSFWRGDAEMPDSYIPTLSELIAACGDRFYHLRKSVKWFAATFYDDHIHELFGDTAEEAVAKLWISLHRKQ